MRKSNFFLIYLAFNLILFFLIFVHASWRRETCMDALREKADLVQKLELTDLCLFTEANYTRHLSQSDLHTPFQDYPMSLEHFPSGSLAGPPAAIRKMNEKLD